jgi:septal ring factor EnvC (AmiA/AmiB activator)
MTEITNELMYEVLKKIQSDVSELKQGQRETNARLNALTTHFVGLQQDISNIYATLTRHDARLDRIERRLEIVEVV